MVVTKTNAVYKKPLGIYPINIVTISYTKKKRKQSPKEVARANLFYKLLQQYNIDAI